MDQTTFLRPCHTDTFKPAYDVAVIGAGVIGCSVAYWLTRRGLDVLLLEAGEIAAGASGACDGFLSVQSKEPGPMMDMTRRSLELFRRCRDELDGDIEFRACGGMLLALGSRELAVLSSLAGEAASRGLEVDVLSPREARSLEPALEAHLTGATICAADAEVNPLNLTQALAWTAAKQGASILQGCVVKRLTRLDSSWELLTDGGDFQAQRVVCCAGAWSAGICETLGIRIPVYPLKGQVLVTESVSPVLSHTVAGAEYLSVKHRSVTAGAASAGVRAGFTAEQTASGNLLIGSTREDAGFDRSSTLGAMQAISELAHRYIPSLERLGIIRSFAGLRPQSRDGLPIIGGVPGLAGFYLATGHGGDGIALSLETGRLLAETVAEDSEPEELRPFSLSRFC